MADRDSEDISGDGEPDSIDVVGTETNGRRIDVKVRVIDDCDALTSGELGELARSHRR
jgi:hypothetical protein